MSPKEQGYMRYALKGSFYTNEKLIHSGIVNDKNAFGVKPTTQVGTDIGNVNAMPTL